MSWDIIGHGWAADFLERTIAEGRSRQAYLITGPDSVGKRTLAIRLAQRLLCTSAENGPCLACEACRQLSQQKHPDMHWLEADQEDGTLKVEVVREMQRQIALAPYQADRRIVFVMRAHEMSPGAANALLKTLEEPPAEVVIILTARSDQSLLPTLVSRCQVIGLRPVAQQELVEGLATRMELPQAELLGALASGLPGLALALAQDQGSLEARRQVINRLDELLAADRISRFEFVEALTKGKDLAANRRRILDLLGIWLSLWRDVMMAAYQAEVPAANPDQSQLIERLSKQQTGERSAAIVDEIQSVMTAITRNANLQLAMESLMLSLPSE